MAPQAIPRGPSPWDSLARATPPPRPPRLTHKIATMSYEEKLQSSTITTSSSVSSPSAPDSDCVDEVDALFEGIDRIRIDDLWSTPRAPSNLIHSHNSAPFRAGLFAPPQKKGPFAPIPQVQPQIDVVSNEPPRPLGDSARSAPALRSCVPLSESNLRNRPQPTPPTMNNGQHADFPRLFKVYSCRDRAACVARGESAECFGYHGLDIDRRRANVASYRPQMCRFIEEVGGCRKADRCPYSHNDFERRYHPDRFGKETCRDFLRGDCPRRYCTFRHEVSNKVEISLTQIDAMNDKELLQLVLKIPETRGKALCEKLLRRFGHGKKHSGWRLEGFNPHGRDDQKIKYVSARVEEVKKQLRMAGEKKWASSLKTSSLRDMMSGVRKVAEEVRERCRGDENYVEAGSDIHRLIRAIFSNTNWSCHSQEGDNPFLVTPENQNEAMNSLEKLVNVMLVKSGIENVASVSISHGYASTGDAGAFNGNRVNMQSQSRAANNSSNQDPCYHAGYLGVGSGGEFGVIGQKVEPGHVEEVPRLWALPSSIGQ